MLDFVYAIPALPLLGFFILLFFGKKLGEPGAGIVGAVAVALSFGATLITWLGLLTHSQEKQQIQAKAFEWMHVGSLKVDVSFLVDPLSMVMALFVSGVSMLIHIYSIGYMKNDPRFHHFFLYMNLFVFSMLTLVLADNFLLMFLGWEGVGVCSYFLVGFWFERDTAATAAKKAFVVNRIGDAGLILGIFLIFNAFGSLTYFADGNGVLERAPLLATGTLTAISLLLFVGAVGKSAQLPLHVWLPDAMEGPTPVSALIHAATMVTAGVYLMVRIAPILSLSSDALLTVAIVGAVSALFAATIACAQDDIKRVLAYSTMSQLGYMFLAVGAGAYGVGIFHMVTHAFFKGLLFLSAGSVIHALHDEQSLKKMGDLRKYISVTFVCFAVGWLAITGIPPFSGFWSKDEVLVAAWEYNKVLYGLALLTVFLTAYYMSRLFFLTFYGKARWGSSTSESKPHESPKIMLIPMAILALLGAVGGFLQVNFAPFKNVLEHFLEPVLGHFSVHPEIVSNDKLIIGGTGVFMSIVGITAAWLISKQSAPWPAKLEPKVLVRAWFIDPLYSFLIEKPGRAIANWFSAVFDSRIIDGLVNGSARLVVLTGSGLRRVQSGYVRSYALSIASGTTLILLWALIRSA